MGQFIKVILIMLGFIAILYAAFISTRFIGKKYGNMGYSKYIEILDRIMVSKDGWIYIVQIGGKFLLIGVTSNNIQVLEEIEYSDLVPIEGEQKADFSSILEKCKVSSYFKRGNGESKDEE